MKRHSPQLVAAAVALEADRRVVTGLDEADPVLPDAAAAADAAAPAAELLPVDVEGANLALPLRPPLPAAAAPPPLVEGESVAEPARSAAPPLPRAAVSW